jgi:hypothetical protein
MVGVVIRAARVAVREEDTAAVEAAVRMEAEAGVVRTAVVVVEVTSINTNNEDS